VILEGGEENHVTTTNITKYKSEMFSFQQPYHEHEWTKFKSMYMKVVVYDIL